VKYQIAIGLLVVKRNNDKTNTAMTWIRLSRLDFLIWLYQ